MNLFRNKSLQNWISSLLAKSWMDSFVEGIHFLKGFRDFFWRCSFWRDFLKEFTLIWFILTGIILMIILIGFLGNFWRDFLKGFFEGIFLPISVWTWASDSVSLRRHSQVLKREFVQAGLSLRKSAFLCLNSSTSVCKSSACCSCSFDKEWVKSETERNKKISGSKAISIFQL